MLELTMGGRCISGSDAITLFETLPDCIPDEVKTEEFCREYEYALNRIRYEVSRRVPTQPEVQKGRFASYTCGACGYGLSYGQKFCSNCGRAANWDV